MNPKCNLCNKGFFSREKCILSRCGFVFHENCSKEHSKAPGKCPECNIYESQSQLHNSRSKSSKDTFDHKDFIIKTYEDQINQLKDKQHQKNNQILQLLSKEDKNNDQISQLKKEEYKKNDLINQLKKEQLKKNDLISQLKKEGHKKDSQIFDLQKKNENLHTSVVACGAQLKDTDKKLNSKINDLTSCEALLEDQKNLTKNLYDLIKEDLKKCALIAAEAENLRRKLDSSTAHCAELEETIKVHTDNVMKETTLHQQFKEDVAAFEMEKTVLRNRVCELERMIAELLSAKDCPVVTSKCPAANKRELNSDPATDIYESLRKKVKTTKNTTENVPATHRILRSSNRWPHLNEQLKTA